MKIKRKKESLIERSFIPLYDEVVG